MGGTRYKVEPFKAQESGPFAAEHKDVGRWVADAAQRMGGVWREVQLGDLKSGRKLLDAEPAQARRYVLAALSQVMHWDAQVERVRAQGKTEIERINAHFLPGWDQAWSARLQTQAVIAQLTRRKLPLEESDLLGLLGWCNTTVHLSTFNVPVGQIIKAVERYLNEHSPVGQSEAMRGALARFAQRLRESHDKKLRKFGTAVEQLAFSDSQPESESVQGSRAKRRPVMKAASGSPVVMTALKRELGLLQEDASVPTTSVGDDQFALPRDSTLRVEHDLLSSLLNEVIEKAGYNSPVLEKTKAGRTILKMDPALRGHVLVAAAERAVAAQFTRADLSAHRVWQSQSAIWGVADRLLRTEFDLKREGLFDILLFLGARGHLSLGVPEKLLTQAEAEALQQPLSEGERYTLHRLRTTLVGGPPLGKPTAVVERLTQLIDDGAALVLVPGEAWSDALNDDLADRPIVERAQWIALLRRMLTATAPRATGKWLKGAGELVKGVGRTKVQSALRRWLPLVSRGRTVPFFGQYAWDARNSGDVMHEENATCLRGLLWLIPTLGTGDWCRLLSAVALSAYRKVPGIGPRAVKVGNAAVYALSEMKSADAVGQLAVLKVKVKFGSAQKEIEKAFDVSATALGVPRDQIEELSVPTCGMEQVGVRRETLGDITVELRVGLDGIETIWLGPDGKPRKAPPEKVKTEFKEEIAEVKTAAKDLAMLLPAQAARLDSMFLAQKRWPLSTWRERYLDHPLVGTLARRLIWRVEPDGKQVSMIWHNGQFVDANDGLVTSLADDATVGLWHPIGRAVKEVMAWRQWLQRHSVRQPFKQAHREVYLLTDAERRTSTYSNRFAAHVLRQHQFNALCATRGWKNRLRLMVDDVYPPATRELSQWGLRAEFWIEGIGEGYGVDTNESGVYLRVGTDQVRFYRVGASQNLAHAGGGGYQTDALRPGLEATNEPLPLEKVPPLVFSEIMRDVDLFVGVASVGNDQTWQDGGPGGRYREYWYGFSFGALSETAKTRRVVLEQLLPRLTILKDRWRLEERFLVVRGDLRTYKIHLGSGNILMEPNDQYLCIVPDQSARREDGVLLPFEGDTTLSLVLSKAFLLARDTAISDPTIVRQIKG
jgi:hypothetical protein